MKRSDVFSTEKLVQVYNGEGQRRLKRVMPKTHPHNETYEHYMCKIASRLMAYIQYGCKLVGLEIGGMSHYDVLTDDGGREFGSKTRIDACGIKFDGYMVDERGRWKNDLKQAKVYGFEAKASVQDFRNGFSAKCPYTFIVCPEGIVQPEMLPKHIGLIWVNFSEFAYTRYDGIVHGVYVVKRASKRMDCYFDVDGAYEDFVYNTISRIGRSNTIDLTFDPISTPCYVYERNGRDGKV